MTHSHHEPDRVLAVHLRAIGAGVQPVLFRIARDRERARADIAAAVLLVPDGRGEFLHVDVGAHEDVLEHRAIGDDLVRDDLRPREIGLAIGVRELPLGQMIGEAERHVAASAGKHVHQDAETFRTPGNFVEHDAGPVLGAQDRFRGKADVLLPGGALDVAHLAQALGMDEPLAQVVVADLAGKIAALVHQDPVSSAAYSRMAGRTRSVPDDKPQGQGGGLQSAVSAAMRSSDEDRPVASTSEGKDQLCHAACSEGSDDLSIAA